MAPQLRNPCPHDIPDEFEIDAEVVVDQSIPHAGHCAPVDCGMLCPELLWDLLRSLADDLEAPDERATECLVCRKRLEGQAGALANQVVGLDHDVAQVVTRLEGHLALP